MPRWIGCPDSNFRRGRPFGLSPEAVVVHIMDGSFASGEAVFRNPTTQTSAHYGISRDGEVHQYVDERDTAFHAGIVVNPTWELLKPRVNPNFYTIGIEHEGRANDVWTDSQLEASASLISEIAARWAIPLDPLHVIRHHEIRASKSCPGNFIDIGKLIARAPKLLAAPAVVSALPQERLPATVAVGTIISADPQASLLPNNGSGRVSLLKGPRKERVVHTIKNVNLRRAKPATTAPLVTVIPANTEVMVANFETGELVAGNSYWYVDVQGNYLWAGATNAPDPMVFAA
jgi:N-acetylmuramoyl-L-alanine amidase